MRVYLGMTIEQLAEKGAAGPLNLRDKDERLLHRDEGHGRGVYDHASS